jgi:hypothetical protein
MRKSLEELPVSARIDRRLFLMTGLTVHLIYEGPTGLPVTVARLADADAVQQVAHLAVSLAEDRVTAVAQTDLVWAELEKVEVIRLRMIVNMLLGKPAPTTAERQPQHAAVGVM